MARPKTGQGKTLYIPQSKLEAVQAILDSDSDSTSKTNLDSQIDAFLMTLKPKLRIAAYPWLEKFRKYLRG